MRAILPALVIALALSVPAVPAVAAPVRDTPAEVVAGFAEAWNRHDMDAFADLFWEEATFVNRGGRLSEGRAAIRAAHAAIHATHLRASRLDNRLEHMRRIGNNVAVALVRSDLTGSARAPAEVVRTRLTFVLERRGREWRIIAAHNATLGPDVN